MATTYINFPGFSSQQANCGTVPTHYYINTKLTVSAANPNYKNTLALNGASGNLVTADGGKTWTVADIIINQYTYTQGFSFDLTEHMANGSVPEVDEKLFRSTGG